MAESIKQRGKQTLAETPLEKSKVTEKRAENIKKKEKATHKRYEIGEKGLTRLRPYCERCGPGYFMADHGNRFSCGHCGFTRYKTV